MSVVEWGLAGGSSAMGGIGLLLSLWVVLLNKDEGRDDLCKVAKGAHNLCEQETDASSLYSSSLSA